MSLNLKKDEIQKKALSSHHEFEGYSTVCLCTGAGKTRIAILRAIQIVKQKPNAKIFLAVPTEKLRDFNWKDEFIEWGAQDIWENNLTRSCYVSVHKEKYLNQDWDLVILDECFPKDQYIRTEKGNETILSVIKQFEKGENIRVLSFDEKNKIFEYKNITHVFKNGLKHLLKIKIGCSQIKCTPKHRFLTISGYKKAKDLIPEKDFIITYKTFRDSVDFYEKNQDFKDFIIGSILGDGGLGKINNKNNIFRCSFIHSEKQKDYLIWKSKLFNKENDVKFNPINGTSFKPAYNFCSLSFFWEEKTIYQYINDINWKSLAIAWMDDGTVSKNKKDILNGANLASTTKYGLEVTQYFSDILNKKFNLNTKISLLERDNKKYYSISFNSKDSRIVSKNIAQYCHPNIDYKLSIQDRKQCSKYIWYFNKPDYKITRVENNTILDKQENVYDIEVEDNHNFVLCSSSRGKNKIISENFVVHNCHHVTPNCIPFFQENEILSILGLTATPPTDIEKKKILNAVAPISFNYTLQQGLTDGIVAPFQIDVIWTDLDTMQNVIEAGPKSKRFKTTEAKSYAFWNEAFEKNKQDILNVKADLSLLNWFEFEKEAWDLKHKEKPYRESLTKDVAKLKQIKTLEGKFAGLQGSRYRIIGSRKSILLNSLNKERIGRRFLNEIFEDDKRYLIFSGSIAQSERLLPGQTFNSSSDSIAYNKFMNEEINKLVVVNSLNEGTNIKSLDQALLLHCSSKELVLIQRVGRVIRVRDNHTGRIYIIVVKNTQDEVWLNSALKGFKNIVINHWNEKDFFENYELSKTS